MDKLLLHFLRGTTTRAEDDQVTAWLRESPDHEAHLKALEEILTLARSRDARMDPGEPPVALALIERAERGADPAVTASRFRFPAWAMAPLAVAATVAFVALGFLGYGQRGPDRDDFRLVAEELTTGAGEFATVRMSDGSLVRLGPESRLQLIPQGPDRQVVLAGRAFFAVVPDEERPFRVHTPGGTIRVLGTRFQVEAHGNEMRLVVVEGSVALTTSGAEVEVQSGQMTYVKSEGAGAPRVIAGLPKLSSEWMGQFLVFQGTPLARAAKEIEEIYNVEVRILDGELEEKTLTMWFSSRPLEDVLTIVCVAIDASCRIEEGTVFIGIRREGLGAVPEEAVIRRFIGKEGSS